MRRHVRTDARRATTMAKMNSVTDQEFQASVLDSETPVLVDFWAEWCVPCHMVSPVVEEIGQEQGRGPEGREAEHRRESPGNAHLRRDEHPSLILFKGGQEVARVIGAKPKDAILRDLEPHLPESRRRRSTSACPVAADRRTTQTRRVRIYRLGDEGPEVGDIQERLTGLDLAIAADELGGGSGRRPIEPSAPSRPGAACGSTGSWGPIPGGSWSRPDTDSATARCTCIRRISAGTTSEPCSAS